MSDTTTQVIVPEIINQAMDYDEYQTLIDKLLDQDKTTGTNHSKEMVHYTKMNVQRMNRLDKQIELSESLKQELDQVDSPWVWLVLTEAWCGDAAQNIPAIVKMAQHNENIDLRFILRDQHLDIMDEYLTNGGRSIPKLICLDADQLDEIGTWGPRPADIQEQAMKWKDDPNIGKKEWAQKLHKRYAENRTRDIQSEFEELIPAWRTR
jgi:hypothetical protein